MAREIWNSKDGFIGTYADYQALVHCLSCQRRGNCAVVDTCGPSEWKHYLKDEKSEFASEVRG